MKPDFVFETSWEVCNKVGGIHTVITSKYKQLKKLANDQFIFIGPDIQHQKKYDNGEFIEDETLLSAWKHKTVREGLRVRTGKWNIEDNPLVILVDFTTFITNKNKILGELWEQHKVDSISGQWEYNEAVLFGYATAKVIESFVQFNFTYKHHIIAHFHEWATASAVLYLHTYVPQIVTLFTTHATTLGRSICSNGQQLYKQLPNLHPKEKSKELRVISKHSIEKNAAHKADCFTTVSEIIKEECGFILEKPVDIVCPNGFRTIQKEKLDAQRPKSRKRLLDVTKAMTGGVSDDAILIATSGRYEYRNKGIDMFISALSELKKESKLLKDVIAFILVPADNYGPRPALQQRLNDEKAEDLQGKFTTHNLHNLADDTIIKSLNYHQFENQIHSKVKIFFIPVYLNGDDGVFDIPYYELLTGFDLSIFPSYYEPWGYTPHESIAHGVPTITSTLAGFGRWAQPQSKDIHDGVFVVERNDENYQEATEAIKTVILSLNENVLKEAKDNALKLAEKATWDMFFDSYKQAYSIAFEKLKNRRSLIAKHTQKESRIVKENRVTNEPTWKKMVIESNLPDNLKFLDELSKNLWWTWSHEARKLFQEINPEIWEKCDRNPVSLLKNVSIDRFNELQNNSSFLAKLENVHSMFKSYMAVKPDEKSPTIAYFSMEYGMTDVIKIYSGGLGILAGDYLKEASDSNIKMVGVGFMYRFGYFTQRLSIHGDQMVDLVPQIFSKLPIEMLRDKSGIALKLSINFPGRVVKARVWKIQVGRIPLYLLDTDTSSNSNEDRTISHQLYGGNWENRFKQELVLGLGGIRLLKHLNIEANVFHLNEGHAAFLNLERLTNLIDKEKFSFDEAIEVVRASSLFTTHTPVPAGHDAFSEDLIRTYLRHIPEQLKISWEAFLGLGRFNPNNPSEKFSMSVFAAKTSQEMNGVSKLHGKVSRSMFTDLWKGYAANELHIGHVTNGVHYNTWISHEWKELHKKTFGKEYINDLSNHQYWKKIYNVPDDEIWKIRNILRKRLIDYIKKRFRTGMIKRREDPRVIIDVINKINKKHLTIGFARRFATYKRAHLLFTDLARLSEIVNNEKMPIQFIFAGKAHPHDKAGQDLIKSIVSISRRKEFAGKILFLENYDMRLARRLITGVDIWFNTPTRPLEASGTSGEKALMNGVLNFSVLDGWWVEGYKEGAGWALPEKRVYENQDFQNQLDAATIYSMLENEIIPLFYKRNKDDIPVQWIKSIKKSLAETAPDFTTKRMIDDYVRKFYNTLFERSNQMNADNCKLVFEISNWKRKIQRGWNNIEVLKVHFPSSVRMPYMVGETYNGTVVLDLKELQDEHIGLEMIFANKHDFKSKIIASEELKIAKKEGSIAYYRVDFKLKKSGVYDWGLRIYPKNDKLPHRMDFPYVRWI